MGAILRLDAFDHLNDLVDFCARHFDGIIIVEQFDILAELLNSFVGVVEGKWDIALSDNFEEDYRMIISAQLSRVHKLKAKCPPE